MNKYFIGDRGFSLLEVVITIAIISIFFLPLVNKFTNESSNISKSKQKSQAISLSRQVINQIKEVAKESATSSLAFEANLKDLFSSSNWNGFQTNSSSTIIWNEIAPPNDFSSNTDYTVKVNFKDTNSSGDLKKVRVRVEWEVKENGSLVTQNEEIVSLITRR
ncbi:MAG: type IV pilus modification PilV family protein [Bacillota bacterium]